MRFFAMNALACALVAGLIAPAEAKSSLKKLRSCLEFKDMTKPRLDCYDAIMPPQIKNSQSTVNRRDCSFEPQRDHRRALSSFDHFTQLLVLVRLPRASVVARTHSTNRITRRRFIRSSARTISGLSSTASRRSTVRVASRGPGSMYSPKMRLASSTARMSVS